MNQVCFAKNRLPNIKIAKRVESDFVQKLFHLDIHLKFLQKKLPSEHEIIG